MFNINDIYNNYKLEFVSIRYDIPIMKSMYLKNHEISIFITRVYKRYLIFINWDVSFVWYGIYGDFLTLDHISRRSKTVKEEIDFVKYFLYKSELLTLENSLDRGVIKYKYKLI